MAGFGKKNNNKSNSKVKRVKTIKPSQIKEEAINLHIKGDINKAKEKYQEFINTGINDEDVLSNYALICQQIGKIEKALRLFKKCIEIFPNHAYACSNLGYLYLTLGNLDEAEDITKRALIIDPKLANAYSTLCLIFKEKGNLFKALEFSEKALETNPKLIDAYINKSIVLKSMDRLNEAQESIEKAIILDSNNDIAYLNLGTILQEKGELIKAEIATKKAISINPNIRKANMNLAAILKDMGKINEAFEYSYKELCISVERQEPYQLVNSLIKESDLNKIDAIRLKEIVGKLLSRKDIYHNDLFISIKYLINDKILIEILKDKSAILNNKLFLSIAKEEWLQNALGVMTFNSLIWETLLTRVRRELCFKAEKESFLISKSLVEFTIALAEQCFLNEYIYISEKDEIECIQKIDGKNIDSYGKEKEFILAIIGCYFPLYVKVKDTSLINCERSSYLRFSDLIDLQIKEPIKEKELKKKIQKFGCIKDQISEKVRIQYEESPYPRWRYTSHTCGSKMKVSAAVNSEIFPNRLSSYKVRKKNRILIAGCGTGIQLFDSMRYQNSEITAIDLSSSSIAYAMRQAKKYMVDDIRFIQMDILDLTQLKEKFDLIECCGVLHHMKSPKKGLSALIKVLNGNGLIKLALYSQIARKDILKARESIKGVNPRLNKDIKKFRSSLIEANSSVSRELSHWVDFYSTSMFRDLCLHVQEHRFNIKSINNLLKEFNLDFLGFVLPNYVKERYKLTYKDDKFLTNLKNWSSFENQYPTTFQAIYQFWVKSSN